MNLIIAATASCSILVIIFSYLVTYSVCILPAPGLRPRIPHCKFSGSGSRERSSKRRGSVTLRRDTLFIVLYTRPLILIILTVLGPALVLYLVPYSYSYSKGLVAYINPYFFLRPISDIYSYLVYFFLVYIVCTWWYCSGLPTWANKSLKHNQNFIVPAVPRLLRVQQPTYSSFY